MRRELVGERAPHPRNAERAEQSSQRHVAPARRDGIDQVLRALLGEPLELDQGLDREVVEVGDVAHQPARDQLVDQLVAEAVDVHGAAAAEVADALLDLRRAGGVDAARDRLAFRLDRLAAAHRAVVGQAVLLLVSGAFLDDHLHHVGNDVTGALDQHPVADPDVLAVDLVLVVEAHVGDGDAAELETGSSDATGVSAPVRPDQRLDRGDARRPLPRRELPRHRPARAVRLDAELGLVGERVHLEDAAVDLVLERVAVDADLGEPLDGGVEVGEARRAIVDLETPALHAAGGTPTASSGRSLELGASSQKKMRSGREAVILASSMRRLPAAMLRGLANVFSPASSRRRLNASNCRIGM